MTDRQKQVIHHICEGGYSSIAHIVTMLDDEELQSIYGWWDNEDEDADDTDNLYWEE